MSTGCELVTSLQVKYKAMVSAVCCQLEAVIVTFIKVGVRAGDKVGVAGLRSSRGFFLVASVAGNDSLKCG